MLPLLVVYFHRLSICALILNIGVSAIMAALIFTAIGALLIGTVSISAAVPLVALTNSLQWLMVHTVDPSRVWAWRRCLSGTQAVRQRCTEHSLSR